MSSKLIRSTIKGNNHEGNMIRIAVAVGVIMAFVTACGDHPRLAPEPAMEPAPPMAGPTR